MSGKRASERFSDILAKNVKSKIKRYSIRADIDKAVKDLSFIHAGLKLKESDISYKLRYCQAIQIWSEAAGEAIDDLQLTELVTKLKKQLLDKKFLFVEDAGKRSDCLDGFSPKESKSRNFANSINDEAVGYVTIISESRIFVKPEDNGDELEVEQQEIPFSLELVNPGDKVVVAVDAKLGKCGKSLTILKCGKLTIEDEEDFIRTFKEKFSSEDSNALTVFHTMFERCKGIWDYIKNDQKLRERKETLRDFLKITALLSRSLSRASETFCGRFLSDVSSSAFFVDFLSDFINETINDPNSDYTRDIEALLKLTMEFSPSSAKSVFKVASSLANALIDNPEKGDGAKNHENCRWAIRFLTNLGEKLTKSIPGSQEVDPTNSAWYDLPTILTQKEIFSERDINSLQPIKNEGPYESLDEYLKINHNLLREECYRNLYGGIRNFCRNPEGHDPRKMKMYRIKLETIFPTALEFYIMLKCELCGAPEDEEICNTSNELLYGNLMCISLDRTFEELVWATVRQFPNEHKKNSNARFIYVKLCSKRNQLQDAEVLLRLHELTEKGDHALMAESPSFFQAFGPSLERLKSVRTLDDIPFKEEIIFAKRSKSPEYTVDNKQNCDWSIIFEKQDGLEFPTPKGAKLSPVDTFKFLKEKRIKSQLDETQLEAIQKFLENRVTLIQGPPGTGKSFLGAKIVQLMLSMKLHEHCKGPILVMTYKNYALDHFLKTCLEHCPKTLRIGRSDTNTFEKLKEINLNNVRKKESRKKDLQQINASTMREMNNVRSELIATFRTLRNPTFTLDSFVQVAEKRHVRSLLNEPSEVSRNKECEFEELLSECDGDVEQIKDCSSQLKEMVKEKLKKWLPMEKFDAKYQSYLKRKQASEERNPDVRANLRKDNLDIDSDLEALDLAVINKERLQNADDLDDESLGEAQDCDNSDEYNGGDINVPLAFISQGDKRPSLAEINNVNDLWKQTDEQRVNFVYALQYKVIKENTERFARLLEKYEKNCKILQDIREQENVDILKKYDVIGMTITGAAMRLSLLSKIKPCAVIVEEAAEILEGQLISALPPTVKHLVMLGDQKQLKPHVSCYELKRYKNLDCSMFERLINNELDYQQLGRQCRMRDDIAQLLRELKIYKDLKTNEEKTRDNYPPKSTEKSLFFWNHTRQERDIVGTNSKYNQAEIEKITEVASHLLKYDYPSDDITVLCAYRGQMQQMTAAFKEKSKDPEDESFAKLKEIKVTTVDSFQGEENKVILLSLVRSNPKQRIGFLAEQNRICVAVSRAQCSLYIFGNATVYENSMNWKKILEYLRKKDLIGSQFALKNISEKNARQSGGQSVTNIYNKGTTIVGDNNQVTIYNVQSPKTDCSEAEDTEDDCREIERTS